MKENYGLLKVEPPVPTVFQNLLQRRQDDVQRMRGLQPASSVSEAANSVSRNLFTEVAKNSVSFEAPVKQVQKVATSDKSTEESWVSISIEAPVKPVTAAVMPEISIESSKNSVNDVAIPPKSVEGPMDIVSVKVLRHPVVASQNDRKVDLGSGDCHLLMLVNKLKKVLDSTWDCVQEDLAEDPSAQPNIWVSRWMHLNKKYGFAYWLSDDSIGILLPGWSFSRMATPFATLIPTVGSRASRCATTRSRWG